MNLFELALENVLDELTSDRTSRIDGFLSELLCFTELNFVSLLVVFLAFNIECLHYILESDFKVH